jgi:cytochrome c oxidase subunit 3
MEYIQAEFSISDSSYGRTFFVATGFHGLHVIIGTTFLRFTLHRIIKTNSNNNRILGFEIAA